MLICTNITIRLKTDWQISFLHNIFLIPVIADGNCLFRALSNIIFGTESKYESFKPHLFAKFRSSPFHFLNEMNKLGLTERQLLDHLTCISAPNEWVLI